MSRFELDCHFRRVLEGDSARADLATLALEIARDAYPDLAIADYLGDLDRMASEVRDRLGDGGDPDPMIRHLNRYLFVEQKYRGNTGDYYNPQNSYLNAVIERKLGIPITLSVLYLSLAERIGLELFGVAMPAHFIVKYQGPSRELFIDPFYQGSVLSREGCEHRVSTLVGEPVELTAEQLAPVSKRLIVTRMLCNLKAAYLNRGELAEAIPVQERLLALRPREAVESRDLGVLYLHAHRPGRAIPYLEQYLRIEPEAKDAEVVAGHLRTARRNLALLN